MYEIFKSLRHVVESVEWTRGSLYHFDCSYLPLKSSLLNIKWKNYTMMHNFLHLMTED